MTDHRRLQRTLFRMHADEHFSRALLSRIPEALSSSGLGPEDLELLLALDPRAVAADPGRRRHSQLLGNSASEFTLGLAAANHLGVLPDLLDGFLTSPDFHGALVAEGRLPLAFGNYALARAKSQAADALVPILTLELAMAHLRRNSTPPAIPSPHPLQGIWPVDALWTSSVPRILPKAAPLEAGCVRLGEAMRLVQLPLGCFNWASHLQEGLERGDSGEGQGAPTLGGEKPEIVLLKRRGVLSSFQLAKVEPELLSSPTDALLWKARTPMGQAERAAFAQERGASAQALETFVSRLIEEGVLEADEPIA